MSEGERHEFFVGALVTWLHMPRGGYGYVFPVDAKVVRIRGKRIGIELARRDGTLIRRYVAPDRLRWRESTRHAIAAARGGR